MQTFVLLAMMALREPDGPNLWHLVGLASRTALAISLNRRDSVYLPTVESGIDGEGLLQAHNERRTNIFWALYGLDRLAMFTLNMPPSIRDEDIDIAVSDVLRTPESKPHRCLSRARSRPGAWCLYQALQCAVMAFVLDASMDRFGSHSTESPYLRICPCRLKRLSLETTLFKLNNGTVQVPSRWHSFLSPRAL